MAQDRVYGNFQWAGVKVTTDAKSQVNNEGTDAYAMVVAINQNGYSLLSNASASGSPVSGIVGGAYVWNVVGTFGGATVTLQALASDGATYQDVTGASVTAGGSVGVVLGNNATVQVVVTGGTPSGLYSSLS